MKKYVKIFIDNLQKPIKIRGFENKNLYFKRLEDNMEFNRNTRIGEILEKAPEKADILLEVGVHCLGCPASQMETLEEACAVHGIDVEEVVKMLNK